MHDAMQAKIRFQYRQLCSGHIWLFQKWYICKILLYIGVRDINRAGCFVVGLRLIYVSAQLEAGDSCPACVNITQKIQNTQSLIRRRIKEVNQ